MSRQVTFNKSARKMFSRLRKLLLIGQAIYVPFFFCLSADVFVIIIDFQPKFFCEVAHYVFSLIQERNWQPSPTKSKRKRRKCYGSNYRQIKCLCGVTSTTRCYIALEIHTFIRIDRIPCLQTRIIRPKSCGSICKSVLRTFYPMLTRCLLKKRFAVSVIIPSCFFNKFII